MQISPELGYIAVLFGLFVIPRALQRFGMPAAVTSLLLGAGAGGFARDNDRRDPRDEGGAEEDADGV